MDSLQKVKSHLHIVFCAEHYNPLGVVRSLGEAGIPPIAIILRSNLHITSRSKYLKKRFFVDSVEEGYRLLLDTFGSQPEKPFVYTCDDTIANFLDAHYDALKDRFFFFNAGVPERIAQFQNKEAILQLAQKHGLSFLKTYTVDVGEIPEGLEYPVITKAIISTIPNWKDDMVICRNESELREAYRHIRSPKVLIQKYIEKKNELCMEGLSVNRGRDTLISIASSYNYLLDNSYSPYMTVGSLHNEELRQKLCGMLEEVGFEGIFEIEFLVDQDDALYFLEINFRNSTWSYASTIAQMPLPVLWAEGMLDPNVVLQARKEVTEPFCAMVEMDDLRFRVKTKQITLSEWLRQWKSSKCKYYWGREDCLPFFSTLWGLFYNKLRK